MNNRWLKLGLLASSVFLLVACGSKTETQDDTETPGYTETQDDTETPGYTESWGVLSDEEHREFVEKFAELKNEVTTEQPIVEDDVEVSDEVVEGEIEDTENKEEVVE